MPEFLLEVGCEELPASFVEKAYRDLADSLSKELEAVGVKQSDPVVYGTPRRLIVSFPELAATQPDSSKEQRGPSLAAAFTPEGEPTNALKGFCKSQGVEISDLRKDDQYVWVTKFQAGVPTAELLATIVPKAILGLNFEKSMRWGASRTRFARPLRWILCAFDGKRVEFEIEGVPSALISVGHRFYAPDPFATRKEMILKGGGIASGTPEVTQSLLDENTFLCEWPSVVRGSFEPDFLQLPEPVLVTAMAKHERMFPVRDAAGKLTNEFLFVRNSGEDETVRRGCEWVLGARFNDARFFFEQDQKVSLEIFLERTHFVLFQAKLGTVRQRADRLEALTEHVAELVGVDKKLACLAGLYSKADLATGLVSELSSLQGVIGGEYAEREGMPKEASIAIGNQYEFDKNIGYQPPSGLAGQMTCCLVIADQIDKLAGYLGIGLEPSGSSDPFGLRRSVNILIAAAERMAELGSAVPAYEGIAHIATRHYMEQNIDIDAKAALESFKTIFISRYHSLKKDKSRDILEASLASLTRSEISDPRLCDFRFRSVERLAGREKFVQTATRPLNIVASAQQKGFAFADRAPLAAIDLEALNSDDGRILYQVLVHQQEELEIAVADRNDGEVERLLLNLEEPITKFFDNTMVMSQDETERFQRLTLAHAAALQLLQAGDFTKVLGS
ncbi:MAG: glycine--tRNA ligase subunit beta [Fimbriimonadaceae bacterium]|nr:glycine--tRNA ligase subunit beta [Fimbriimonadaceae bacterium]